MEQQIPGSPAVVAEAGASAGEGQGSLDASQTFPGAEGIAPPQLVQAILTCDDARLRELLAGASPEQLAATQPFSLFHAAAIVDNAEAVCTLADAGVPLAALNTQGTALTSLSEDESTQQQLMGWHFTPLDLAAWMAHGAVVATMLVLGADPEAPSLDTSTQPASQRTPLGIVVGDPLPGSSEAVADLLLTVGADVHTVGPAEMERCDERCPGLASLLRAVQCGPGGAEGAEAGAGNADHTASALSRLTLGLHEQQGLFLPPTPPPGASVLELLPPYHRAVLRGEAHTVGWLHYVGLPAEVADACCYGPAAASQLHIEPEWLRQLLGGFSGSALGLAALLGDTRLIAALVEIGADVNQPSPQVPGVLTYPSGALGTLYRPARPLDIVACCSEEFGGQQTEALLSQLLEAGADVTQMSRRSLASCGRGPALLLLERLQQASEEGQLELSAEDEFSWSPLLGAAVETDSLPALEHFLGRVLQLPVPTHTLWTAMPNVLLSRAARHGSLGVLRLAAQGAAQLAAGGAAEEGSAVARVFGPRFEDKLPGLLVQAAKHDHVPAVQLLLELGGGPSAQAVQGASSAGAAGALRALLSRGLPSFADPLPQPLELHRYSYSYGGTAYHCPILAALRTRLEKGALRSVDARTYFERADVVHPWDAKLLPGLEALLEFGYRPRIFTDALVRIDHGEPVVRDRFDPLHLIEGDPRLKVAGANRWLALCAARPAWSLHTHSLFLPAFLAATRTLLLVVHRGSSSVASSSAGQSAAAANGASEGAAADGAGGSTAATEGEEQAPLSWAAGLASLPRDLLHGIIGQAAYPLSAWAPLDAAATQAVMGANGWEQMRF